MTTLHDIWSHDETATSEAMTWLGTTSLAANDNEGVPDVTVYDVNITMTTVLLAPDVTPSRWQLMRFLIIVVTSLLSNLLVVLTVKKSPRLQSTLYYYLSSLAVMDIIDSLIIMPVAFARTLLNEITIFSGWCQCWQTVVFGLAAGTLVHIIMGTTHCYLMIGTPLTYHKFSHSTHAILQVSLCWVIPVLLSVPAIIILVTRTGQYEGVKGWECALADYRYMTAALVPMYYVPVLVSVLLFISVALKVKKQDHMSSQLQNNLPGTPYSNGIHKARKSSETSINQTMCKTVDEKQKSPVHIMASSSAASDTANWDTSQSDAASQDYEDDDISGKDKDMLIAEIHACNNRTPDILSDIQHRDISSVSDDYTSISVLSSDYENISSTQSFEIDSDLETTSETKVRSGKEKLNEPLDDADIQFTLETAELLKRVVDTIGTDNPAYSSDDYRTPLADSIQVKHDQDTKHPELQDEGQADSDSVLTQGHHSRGSSYQDSEQGECGIKATRRSILRRDNSRRISKKVQFAIPESHSNEGKSAKRIRRRPTGLRYNTRKKNIMNANVTPINHISNGKVPNLSIITSLTMTNGITVPQSTFEYMVQVQQNQGLRISRRIQVQQLHCRVLCSMSVMFGLLSMPYMLSYTILTLCPSCRDRFPEHLAMSFEWMHHASSAVNLLLYLFFNPEFRESLANLCGCK